MVILLLLLLLLLLDIFFCYSSYSSSSSSSSSSWPSLPLLQLFLLTFLLLFLLLFFLSSSSSSSSSSFRSFVEPSFCDEGDSALQVLKTAAELPSCKGRGRGGGGERSEDSVSVQGNGKHNKVIGGTELGQTTSRPSNFSMRCGVAGWFVERSCHFGMNALVLVDRLFF